VAALTTGFLSDTSTISLTLPAGFNATTEASSAVVLPNGGCRSVLWTDRGSGQAMAASANLTERAQHSAAGGSVTEYAQPDPFTGQFFTTVLRFRPTGAGEGYGWMWLTLDPDFDDTDTRDLLVSAITPTVDANGLPRFRIAPPLRLGSPLDPAQRDMIAFFAPSGHNVAMALRLWNTGALSSDNTAPTPGAATVGTATGVSVQSDGTSTSDAQSRAQLVANTLRRHY
jgi:hypothetical protein